MYPQSALTGGGTRDYYPNEIARQLSTEGGRAVASIGGRPRDRRRRMAARLASLLSPSRGRSGDAPLRPSIADPAGGPPACLAGPPPRARLEPAGRG